MAAVETARRTASTSARRKRGIFMVTGISFATDKRQVPLPSLLMPGVWTAPIFSVPALLIPLPKGSGHASNHLACDSHRDHSHGLAADRGGPGAIGCT